MSHLPSKALLPRVRRAAQMRATGHQWADICKTVDARDDTVRKWAEDYPAVWRAAFAGAWNMILEEALAEAVSVLRFHLRGDQEPKTKMDAARKLIDCAGPHLAPKDEAPAPADRLTTYLEGLSDGQLNDLVAQRVEQIHGRIADRVADAGSAA